MLRFYWQSLTFPFPFKESREVFGYICIMESLELMSLAGDLSYENTPVITNFPFEGYGTGT